MNLWRRQWQPTPVLLPGKSHGQRSLVGCSPWGREESGTTERLHFHFSLSCTGEGNGNPLQCSCLLNLRDGGAWWAAVYGVAQSQTQLKRLSSSSSRWTSKTPSSVKEARCRRPHTISFHSYEISRKGKLTETGSRTVAPQSWDGKRLMPTGNFGGWWKHP